MNTTKRMSEGIQFRLNAKQMNQQNNGRIKKKKGNENACNATFK